MVQSSFFILLFLLIFWKTDWIVVAIHWFMNICCRTIILNSISKRLSILIVFQLLTYLIFLLKLIFSHFDLMPNISMIAKGFYLMFLIIVVILDDCMFEILWFLECKAQRFYFQCNWHNYDWFFVMIFELTSHDYSYW